MSLHFRRLLTLVLLCHGTASLAAGMTGVYVAGDLGLLEFTTSGDGEVSGRFRKGGACGFSPDRVVMKGIFDGDVFVGTVTVCQRGTACEEKSFPFMGIWHESKLVGAVRLDDGCKSPALSGENHLLQVEVASAEDRKAAQISAALIAKGNNKQDLKALAAAALLEGQSSLDTDVNVAAQKFERAISYYEDWWPPYAGLGVAAYKLGNFSKARTNLKKSIELGEKDPRVAQQELAQPWVYLGLVDLKDNQRKAGMSALRTAFRLAPGLAAEIAKDGDADFLKNDGEFKKLVADIARRKTK